jgi:hypothetical protein
MILIRAAMNISADIHVTEAIKISGFNHIPTTMKISALIQIQQR